MKQVLALAMLVALTVAASACGSSHPSSVRGTSSSTESSSRMILGGTVQCTATVTTPVQVGHELGITFTFHNISKNQADVRLSYGGVWVIARSTDGTTYDTRVPLENAIAPPSGSIPLRPGATITRHLVPRLHVRWVGPLRVTPGCDVSAAPPVRVAVTSPGLPATATAAVNDVVAATGHLLDHCRPQTAGVSVVGRIDPPSGDAPPLQARCSVDLRREPGFYNAQVLVLTPPDLQGVQVEQPYEAFSGPNGGNRNTEAIAWEFVVTRQGATSVGSADYVTSRSGGRRAPDWFWFSSGPKKSGDFQCGGGGGQSGDASGPDVSFIAACGRGR
jgi:hypothetical protein